MSRWVRKILPAKNNWITGFSLLELLVVMMIMALAVSFVGPRISNKSSINLKSQVRRIVALLKYAERRAIIQGRPEKILIRRVMTSHDDNAHAPVKMTMIQKNGDVTLSGSDDPELTTPEKIDSNKDEMILFFPDGGNSGGIIQLDSAGDRAVIRVNPVSGKITVDYTEGK